MIIHDWPEDQAIEILRNVRAAAEVGTTLLLIETVIPDHSRDHVANWTNLEMLLMNAGRERTAAQYRDLLQRARLPPHACGAIRFTVQPCGGQSDLARNNIRRITRRCTRLVTHTAKPATTS